MKSWFNFMLAIVVLGNQIWFQPSLISSAAIQPASQAQTIAIPNLTQSKTKNAETSIKVSDGIHGDDYYYNQKLRFDYMNIIQKEYFIKLAAYTFDDWNLEQTFAVFTALVEIEHEIDPITGGGGRKWIQKNLGGTEIVVGTERSAIGILTGRPHVEGSTIYLLTNFEQYAFTIPGYRVDLMIMHELAHVWDNQSADGIGSIFGGGCSDALMDFIGGRSTGALGLRFLDKSLDIPSSMAVGTANDPDYGHNSSSDYFAETFTAAVAAPHNSNVPALVELWINALIDLTK